MIYRDTLTGDILDLTETTEHAASSYRQSVLVDRNGYAWDRWTVRPIHVEAKRYRPPRPTAPAERSAVVVGRKEERDMIRIAINSDDLIYGTTADQRQGINLDETWAEYARQIREAVYQITDEPVEITIGAEVEPSVYVEDDETEEQVNDAIQGVFDRQDFWR